jgi:predicted DNA binding CopG/RHH family protein
MKKKIPTFKNDVEAERFVATSDLTQYDLRRARAVQFEFEPKASQLNMRLPVNLLDAVKQRAKLHGIPYTRFIREVLEQSLREEDHSRKARRR